MKMIQFIYKSYFSLMIDYLKKTGNSERILHV